MYRRSIRYPECDIAYVSFLILVLCLILHHVLLKEMDFSPA